MDTPPRDIGPKKQKARSGPAKKLRHDVVAAIQGLAYLGSRPVVTPIYTGHVVIDEKRYSLGRPGASDLHCCWHGHSFHIELKAGGDQMRSTQIKYAERVREAHGTYIECRSPKDALDVMVRWYQINVAKLQPKS